MGKMSIFSIFENEQIQTEKFAKSDSQRKMAAQRTTVNR